MSEFYPMWMEKIVFLLLIGVGIYAGMKLSDYIDGVELWFSWICGIPILILVFTELIGRIIQTIHTRD